MKLLIKGFSKQSIIQPEDVKAQLLKLPRAHIESIASVVYDPSRFFQRSYAVPKAINYRTLGEYSATPTNHVLVYRFKSKSEFQHILIHEVGHHVFKHILSSTKRKEWVTKLYPNSNYVTDYAKTNASEDFAESYAIYWINRHLLELIPRKLKFISSLM